MPQKPKRCSSRLSKKGSISTQKAPKQDTINLDTNFERECKVVVEDEWISKK